VTITGTRMSENKELEKVRKKSIFRVTLAWSGLLVFRQGPANTNRHTHFAEQ
jgi:hypothetical protein